MEPTNSTFMHIKDSFLEFIEAFAKSNMAWPKPPRPKFVNILAKEKARLKTERMATKAAQKLKAMIKMDMIPPNS